MKIIREKLGDSLRPSPKEDTKKGRPLTLILMMMSQRLLTYLMIMILYWRERLNLNNALLINGSI